ncbi:MAB_1171c family putative transporter (plasmid) [Streptomyces sp. R39]|uniref:MAB_1171c family putative transporter n=1 Tax=Streptomyces sp. R39 TaxID=3238631 RepID=A0AB39R5B6_9ACTN
MSGAINYVSCAVLWIGLLVKLPDLVHQWNDLSLRAINVLLASASLCFLLGAPPTVGLINRVSGVPNLAAPITYASITTYSASSLVLIALLRGGPSARQTIRRWIYAYLAVVAGIAVLFSLGSAPEERRTDFDTHYATTPWIGQMIVLYLVAHLTAVTVSSIWSLRWAGEAEVSRRPWLRASLRTIGAGTIISAGYSLPKLVAVAAKWSGRDWSMLGTAISPLGAGLGALLTVVGLSLPLVGHHLAAWRHFMRLAPLDAVLDPVLKTRALRVTRPRSPFLWTTWRRSTIINGLHAVESLFNGQVYNEVFQAELTRTGNPELADVMAWAATIAAAARGSAQPAATSIMASPASSVPRDPHALVLIADALKELDRSARVKRSSSLSAGSV